MGSYDIAQICLNGHVINEMAKSYPQHNQDYCDKCGAKTITKCQHCNTDIRGDYHSDIPSFGGPSFQPPSHCYKCGKPFPWTENKLIAAKELAMELDEFDSTDIELLSENLKSITSENPQTQVAAIRVKKLLSKVGKPIGDAFYKILVDVASETAKKTIWPDS